VVNFRSDETDLIGKFVDITVAEAYSNSLLGTDPRNPG
jgi:tRNA-2-methylthio-N6-dimethylallyladenosine synthase